MQYLPLPKCHVLSIEIIAHTRSKPACVNTGAVTFTSESFSQLVPTAWHVPACE